LGGRLCGAHRAGGDGGDAVAGADGGELMDEIGFGLGLGAEAILRGRKTSLRCPPWIFEGDHVTAPVTSDKRYSVLGGYVKSVFRSSMRVASLPVHSIWISGPSGRNFWPVRLDDPSRHHIVAIQSHTDSVCQSGDMEVDASQFGWHVMKYEFRIGRREGSNRLISARNRSSN
jgi:hypothetical protein